MNTKKINSMLILSCALFVLAIQPCIAHAQRSENYPSGANPIAELIQGTAVKVTAQGRGVGRARTVLRHPTHAVRNSAQTPPPGSSSYTFTYFGYPQGDYAEGFTINSGAASSKVEIVGSYGPQLPQNGGFGNGFLLQLNKSKATTSEAYQTVNLAGYSLQQADGINDLGQIVGTAIDDVGNYHGYLLSGGTFTSIEVPFSGATSTLAEGINNSGDIVGVWDEDDNEFFQSFELSGATYTQIAYPGALETEAISINNKGDVSGYYYDSAGIYHGFLLSGGTYTSIDVPGAVGTMAFGINDSGNIVGVYCITSDCNSNFVSPQGFLLSGGVYKTINVANEPATYLSDINNKGVMVGWYIDSVGTTLGFIATP